jgi:predicted ATP-dependent endonuclease of OLD family
MNNNQEKYIKHVQIEGFWGRYDVDWQLNSDVNILVGENGTGKSSLLMLLNLILNSKKAIFTEKFMASNNVKIYENNERKIFEGKIVFATYADSRKTFLPQGHMSSTLNVDYLTTFDTNLVAQNDLQNNSTVIKTALDFLLKKTLDEFSSYELRQTRKAARNEMTFAQALEKKNYLVSTINRLFKNTEKRVDDEQGDFAFRLNNDKN